MGDKKKGRPTDNPKGTWTGVRLDQKGQYILEKYCEEHNVSKSEAIRRAIYLLEDQMTSE